ncbi:MAG: KH domain-containing protein [Clostridiales bacterium]|nr:KH domain-containing protein [Clostridiales bacterium]
MVDVSNTLANIAKAIVDNPDEVKVIVKEETANEITLELVVAPDDMGKVIGKQGRIAKAIRQLLKTASVSINKKVTVDIR